MMRRETKFCKQELFDPDRAELFDVPGKLIIPAGEEIPLE